MLRIFSCLIGLVAAYALGYEFWQERGALIAGIVAVCLFLAWDEWRLEKLDEWLKSEPLKLPAMHGFWGELQYHFYKRIGVEQARVQAERDKMTHFFSAIQASPNGVALLDGENRIEWLNAQLAGHLDIHQTRDQGQRIAYVVRHPEFVSYLAERDYRLPVILNMPVNRRVEAQCFEIGDHRYAPYSEQRKLLLTRDVTEQEQVNAMRRDFVANVSHELKTPLTVLKGFLETLQTLELSAEERSHYLNIMHTQSERMQNLVSDLLTLAKLESGDQAVEMQLLAMKPMIETLYAQALALSGGRHRITLQCADSDDELPRLMGNQTELMSAFGNLISNAIAYTPDGGSISIRWSRHDQGAEFAVTDTGIGFVAEHVPRLTERFYRVDKGRSKLNAQGREWKGGTGLGLAIVKHVLQRHGAELLIESVEGKGSTFTACFPQALIL